MEDFLLREMGEEQHSLDESDDPKQQLDVRGREKIVEADRPVVFGLEFV